MTNLHTTNLEHLGPEDVALYSFPRSGNTWIRFCIADVYLQLHGYTTSTDLPVGVRQIIPTLTRHSLDDTLTWGSGWRLYKTHKHSELDGRRFIYIVRQPLDCLRSFHRFETKGQGEAIESLEAFCARSAPNWRRHVSRALKLRGRHPDRCIFVSFEEMHADPVRVLTAIFRFLGEQPADGMIQTALHNQNLENRREASKSKPSVSYDYGEGQIGLGQQLPDRARRLIASETSGTWEKARRAVHEDLHGVAAPSAMTRLARLFSRGRD